MRARTVNNADRHRTDHPMTRVPLCGFRVYILLLALALAWVAWTPLSASESGTPTPEETHTAVVLPATATPEPAAPPSEPRAWGTPQTSIAPEQPSPVQPSETPTAEPTATHAGPQGTAHLAVLVSQSIVPVGGSASSEVLVHMEHVWPGIVRLRLVLHFDPQVVQVQDADANPANGTQIAPWTFFKGTQTVVENQADNTRGEVTLALVQAEHAPVNDTASWLKVATIIWVGRQAGNSALTIAQESRFTDLDGRELATNALHHGTAFVRWPGQISGQIWLQGRTEHGNTRISGTLAAARVDRSYTGLDGSFVLTASHGEGFYTLSASAPGFLSAKGSRPVKLTVGSEFKLAPITLVGGDVNQDNLIDIRDLSYVAYHMGSPDVQADINGDGQVDVLDLTLIAGNFGIKGPTTWPVSD